MSNLIDLTGKHFGRWTVLEKAPSYRNREGMAVQSMWRCICDPERGGCGAVKEITGTNLRNGVSRSCGCLRRQTSSLKRDRTGSDIKV